MTNPAVWFFVFMLSAKLLSVARQAFAPIKGDLFFLLGRGVRIMATRACHFIAGFLLANALSQRLGLAQRPQPSAVGARQNVIADVIREIFSCLKFRNRVSGLLN